MEYQKAHINRIFFTIVMSFYAVFSVHSQTITKPSFDFRNICATSVFNEFEVTATISAGFPTETIFSLELSNADNSFVDNTLLLDIVNPENERRVGNIITLVFSFPINFQGSDTLRLRIVPSLAGLPSPASDSFSAYYSANMIMTDGSGAFSIEPRCSTTGTLRASPSDLSNYVWYRNGVIIPGENSSILNTTQNGNYQFSDRPVGNSCIGLSVFLSNISRVLLSSGIPIAINGPTSYLICDNETVTLVSNETSSSFVYQWVKDGEAIPGEQGTELSITGIDAEGNYSIQVSDSQQNLTDGCTTESAAVSVELRNPSIKIVSPTGPDFNIVLLPGASQTITVETRGGNPMITWIKDGVDIPGESGTSLVLNEPGVYEARLTAESPCPINTVTTKNKVTVVAPENLAVSIDYDIPDYEDCAQEQVLLQITQVSATVNSQTSNIPEADFVNLNVQWFNNGVDTGQTGSTLLITDASNNGNYRARVTVGGQEFNSINELSVVLSLGSLSIEAPNRQLAIGETLELTVPLPDGAIVSQYTFQWFRGVTEITTGGNTNTLTVSNAGTYSVRVGFPGCPETPLESVTIRSGSAVIPNILTPNSSDGTNRDWELPEELTLQPDVEIVIYNANGEIDFSGTNYDGQWPDNSKTDLKGTIYYYVISKDNNPIEQGTITIIR